MLYLSGSNDIKDLLAKALQNINFKGLSVLDFPTGSGHTSGYLQSRGAHVTPLDMFPEFFKNENIHCISADLQKTFPLQNAKFDVAIFQEGIEHLPDQLFSLKEFHRVLKPNGTLIVTTPNYSNFRSRMSYLLFEAETPKLMPPNEIESLWYGQDNRVYMGHIFSLGIMKLRMLAHLSGFEVVRVHPSRINFSAFLISLIFYPLILLHTFKTYLRACRKQKERGKAAAQTNTFKDLVKLNLDPNILLGGHLIVELRRVERKDPAYFSFEKVDKT